MVMYFVLLAFLLGAVCGEDVHMETVFAVTGCRAACLDKHVYLPKTEENCKKDIQCIMCWETCEMLLENFEIWGPMCDTPKVCLPGCQTACKTLSNTNFLKENDDVMPLAIKTTFNPKTMRFTLEWIPENLLDSDTTILYTVLFRDKGQDWQKIAQTISHDANVKANLMGRTTTIRLLAANATHQIAFGETNYVNSLILGTEKPVYMEEKDWSPKLLSLVQSDTSTGTLATITWPSIPDEFGPSEYEVSWNAVGDPIEVTGHLQTSKNIAVLTLWPDSLYLVTVDRYTSSGVIYGDTTQTLIINTKQSENPLLTQSTTLPCQNDGDSKFNMYLAVFACSVVSTSLFFLIILTRNGQLYRQKYENSRLYEKINSLRLIIWQSSELFSFRAKKVQIHPIQIYNRYKLCKK